MKKDNENKALFSKLFDQNITDIQVYDEYVLFFYKYILWFKKRIRLTIGEYQYQVNQHKGN